MTIAITKNIRLHQIHRLVSRLLFPVPSIIYSILRHLLFIGIIGLHQKLQKYS